MRALIVDVETTGTDPDRDRVVELGACLYDTDHGIVWVRSELYACTENAAQDINGIAPPLTVGSKPWPGTGAPLPSWATMDPHACVVSHGMFDSLWFDSSKPWVDTCEGFDWPRPSGRSLAAVALAHGVGVVRAHRAFDDVLTLATCFGRVPDLEARLRAAMRPRAHVRAVVSSQRAHLARAAGFRWDPEHDRWVRWVFRDESFPFDTYEVRP